MSTSLVALQSIEAVQRAFTVISTLGVAAYLNPFDGCAANESSFHYIIIGGGTSGSVIANRLTEDKKIKVLVIEAGTDIPLTSALAKFLFQNKRSHIDWNITTENDNYTMQCNQERFYRPTIGKVLGGSSSVDFMLHSQGDRQDYEDWADLTSEPAWRSENVQRLLKKIERFHDEELKQSEDNIYHGFDGNVGITKEDRPPVNKYLDAFKDVGHNVINDINFGNGLGYTRAAFNIYERRQSSSFAYLYPVRDRTNMVILKSSTATQILFDEKKKAIAVKILSKNKEVFVFKAKREIIVAAGAFHTPKLLQLSGIGPNALLKKFKIDVISDVPVGDNYMNHVAVSVSIRTQNTCGVLRPQDHYPRILPGRAIVGTVALNKTQKYPDYRTVSFITTWTPPIELIQYTSGTFNFKHCINDYIYKDSYGKEVIYTLVHGLKPKSRGTVQIRNKDPATPVIVKTGFFSNKEDLKAAISYVKDFLRVKESTFFKEVNADYSDGTGKRCSKHGKNSDEYWECYILCMMTPINHHAGTAAMGSVVDGRLRVKGVKGLRVADSSIMPTLVSGSFAIPVMMIGENAADMIKEDWEET